MTSLTEMTLKELRTARDSDDIKQSLVALMMNVQDPAISKLERKPLKSLPLGKVLAYLHAIEADVSLSITLKNGETLQL